MAQHTIQVHADELEYTPNGLRTPSRLLLNAGEHNLIVVKRPTRVPALPLTLGGFGFDSSFPTAAVVAPFIAPAYQSRFGERFDATRELIYQVYGHAQTRGKIKRNKPLSDRRAQVVAALLTGEVEAVEAIGKREGWGPREQQVMLRVLRCDPGPIDGEVGDLTAEAVGRFQAEYRDGAFHRDTGRQPRNPALQVDADLGPQTKAALIEAFVVFCSPLLPSERLHPTHPTIGCTEFNQLPDVASRPELSRRVSLVVHEQLAEFHDRAPCKADDHTVCPVDDDAPRRCLWYRAHVIDPSEKDVLHTHFDLRWLPLPNGKIILSALTTVPDAEQVQFEVFSASRPVEGESLEDPSVLIEPLSDVITTKPTLGVAQAVWDPPAGFSPGLDGRIASADGARVVPVFRITHARTSTVAYDPWPADEVAVLFDRSFIDATFTAHAATAIELLCAEQQLRLMQPTSRAEPYDAQHYILRFEGLRPEGRFSLLVHYGDSTSRTIFEDVAYDDLDDHGPPSSGPPLEPAGTADAASADADAGPERDGDDNDDDGDEDFPLLALDDTRDERSLY